MLEDLRLDKPFPELKEHVQSYDLDHMEKKDHSHTPWIVIVAKYREKAKKDIAAVGNHAAKLLQSLGKAPESISERELKLFCSNSAFLRVVRCRSLSEEYGLNTFNKDEIISHMDNPDSELVLYLMLRAVDRFYKQHGRYPGVYNYQVEDDIGKLKSCLTGFLQEHGLSVVVKDDYVHEFCRYGAAEPHAIAAFMGGKSVTGFLRHEVIKVITGQFVIFNNTYIYSEASEYFREIGGLMFINDLAKSSVHCIVKEAALFTLGVIIESNAYVQKYFVSVGGLDTLAKVLIKLMQDSCMSHSSIKLAVVVTKTLDACIANDCE
ncbi:nedd8-activating enzyme e1 regulatory subunit [Limosa lapponica baueri]|uniref:NEDD8-activating enzyme E1 regulatory subunit n=1 Tax=Limosa lapponica baueri TaxID=1758121 RepID=A0A2I0TCG9_LIMLA|nr:nedd8-activating enzyme e1 regulatory subunit [Limosa lapponica baueri]